MFSFSFSCDPPPPSGGGVCLQMSTLSQEDTLSLSQEDTLSLSQSCRLANNRIIDSNLSCLLPFYCRQEDLRFQTYQPIIVTHKSWFLFFLTFLPPSQEKETLILTKQKKKKTEITFTKKCGSKKDWFFSFFFLSFFFLSFFLFSSFCFVFSFFFFP